MKRILPLAALALLAFTYPKSNPARVLTVTDFLSQLNCAGPGCVSASLIFPTPDAVSFAYPSPLSPAEQAAIYAPGNPVLRGYDESYSVVVGGDYTVPVLGGRESEGRLAVGGNLVINNTSYGVAQSGGGTFVVGAGGATFPVAVEGTVGGIGSLGAGFNKGGAYIVRSGGANTLAPSGAGSVGQTKSANQGNAGVNIAGIISGMQTVSANMLETSATGVYADGTFTGTGATKEVFTVNNSDITDNLVYFEGIAPGATVVVNINGTGIITVNWTAQIGRAGEPVTTDQDAQVYNVIFNFGEAAKVNFNAQFIGTSLIPDGDAEVNRSYDGRLYVLGNLIHSGESSEIHNYPFTGDLTPYQESPLPVNLTSFQVKTGKSQNVVSWTTTSEIDFSHFEIHHSADARDWSQIGTVVSEGNKSAVKPYLFTHSDPVPGHHYYRLKMVDSDGTFELSRIQRVYLDADLSLSVYPNPATDVFHVDGLYNPDQTAVHVKVLSADGRLLGQFVRSGSADLKFEISRRWPKGILFIQVGVGGGNRKTLKFFNL